MPKKTPTGVLDAADNASKAARTRARIVSAAAQVLSEKGYAGTRLSDVAIVAELQAPAIYYYFDSREDLIEEVVQSGMTHVRKHVSSVLEALPASTSSLDRIDAVVAAHLEHVLQTSELTTASIRNSGQLPSEMRARLFAEQEEYGNMWRELFARAEMEGVLRPGIDVGAARMLVLGALNWAAEWWDPDRGQLDEVIRTAQTLVRHGLSDSVTATTTTTEAARKSASPRKTRRAVSR